MKNAFILGEVYDVFYTGNPPEKIRIFLIGATSDQWIKFNMYMGQRTRYDVYTGTRYQLPLNAIRDEANNIVYQQPPNGNTFKEYFYQRKFIERRNSPNGLNIYDQDTLTMSIAVKSKTPIQIILTPVVLLELGFPASDIDDFFEANLISNLASALGLQPSQIRIVQAVSEDTEFRRRKRSTRTKRSTVLIIYRIEIGEPPAEEQVEPDNSVINESEAVVDDEIDYVPPEDSEESANGDTQTEGPDDSADSGESEDYVTLSLDELEHLTETVTQVLGDGSLEDIVGVEVITSNITVILPKPTPSPVPGEPNDRYYEGKVNTYHSDVFYISTLHVREHNIGGIFFKCF